MRYPEAIKLMREAGLTNEDGSPISDTQDLSTKLEKVRTKPISVRRVFAAMLLLSVFPR